MDMNLQSQEILRSALTLSESEREDIAASVIRSLDAEADPEADQAWAAEIAKRVQSVDDGATKLIPWDDVIQEMRDSRSA